MTRDELTKIIEKHEKWLNGEDCGERADLRGVNLRGVNLRGVNLYGADLYGADLRDADLYGADLCDADLSHTHLCGVDLRDANLRGANLRGANLRGADLCGADLRHAYMRDANLCNADLCGAKNLPYIPMSCPDSGSFTAWKKANGYIVKLLIPEDARRSSASAIGRKCRCDKAQVIAIENIDGTPADTKIVKSDYDRSFVYEVGKTVTSDFCEYRFIECAPGIHFFINRQEAVEWGT